MQKDLNIVMLHPDCPNYGLVKDVGQIPYSLNQIEGISAGLASSKINMSGEHQKYLSGMQYYPLHDNNSFLDGLLFILKHAKKVDWFVFFFGGRRCYYWTKLYKFLNPKGKVYIKMDLSYACCRRYSESKKERAIFLKTSNSADIVSVESERIRNILKEATGYEAECIPNGYIGVEGLELENIVRQNVFLTVARLGDESKATDILLEAFAQSACRHDWNLKLVGPVEKDFQKFVDDFYVRHPDMRNRVEFTGAVLDKAKLYSFYREARVFVLPSRWEGSPLVVPEALSNGCRLILSDVIPPIEEFTNNLRYGCVVKPNSVDSLSNALIMESKREFSVGEHNEIIEYAKGHFKWEAIVKRLLTIMYNK